MNWKQPLLQNRGFKSKWMCVVISCSRSLTRLHTTRRLNSNTIWRRSSFNSNKPSTKCRWLSQTLNSPKSSRTPQALEIIHQFVSNGIVVTRDLNLLACRVLRWATRSPWRNLRAVWRRTVPWQGEWTDSSLLTGRVSSVDNPTKKLVMITQLIWVQMEILEN